MQNKWPKLISHPIVCSFPYIVTHLTVRDIS